MPNVLLPAAFVSANLILYWGGYDYTWKIAVALVVGLVIFGIGSPVAGTDALSDAPPGHLDRTVDHRLGHHRGLGRYGDGSTSWLPEWIDLLVVIVFSLVIFYWAVQLSRSATRSRRPREGRGPARLRAHGDRLTVRGG